MDNREWTPEEDESEWTRRGASRKLGETGEHEVAEVLRSLGHEVEHFGHNSFFDIVLSDRVTVEVKTALATKRPGNRVDRWQFILHKKGDGRPMEEDILILRCQTGIGEDDEAYHYVIPGKLLNGDLTKIDIASHPEKYGGKYSLFLEAWALVDAIVAQAEKEGWTYAKANDAIPF